MNNVDEKENLVLNAENAKKEKKEAITEKIYKTIIGLVVVTTLLHVSLVSAAEYDRKFDHTEGECIFAKILPSEEAIDHQTTAMIGDYIDKGIMADVDVKYTHFDGNEPVREIYAPYGAVAKEGNELITDEEGRQYWVAYESVEPIKNVVDGKVNYIVPEGYTLGKDRNGNLVGIKKRIAGFASQSFENDEKFKLIDGMEYIKLAEESIDIDGYGYRSIWYEYNQDGTIEKKSDYLRLSR